MKKILMAVAIVMIGSSCYAGNLRSSDTKPRPISMKHMEDKGKGMKEKNKAIMDVGKQLFELKKFKMETIHQNLKIDTKALADMLNKKINDLKLSNATFDSLRASAKNNMERMAINKLENKFIKFQMMLKGMAEGLPKFEEENPEEDPQPGEQPTTQPAQQAPK